MTPSDSLTPEQREAMEAAWRKLHDFPLTDAMPAQRDAIAMFAAGLAFREASPSEATHGAAIERGAEMLFELDRLANLREGTWDEQAAGTRDRYRLQSREVAKALAAVSPSIEEPS